MVQTAWFLTAMSMITASQELRFDFSPVTALWLIVSFLIVLDYIKRILKGVGPFTADRDHLHHKLMDRYTYKYNLDYYLHFNICFISK